MTYEAMAMYHYCEFLFALMIFLPIVVFEVCDVLDKKQRKREKEELDAWWADIQKKLAEHEGRE